MGEIPRDLGAGPGTGFTESEVLAGIDKISKHLEIHNLFEEILESGDRRLARQRRTEAVARGRDQVESWYRNNILKNKITVDTRKANEVKWDRENGIFADVLLRADEDFDESDDSHNTLDENSPLTRNTAGPLNGIPVGSMLRSRSISRVRKTRKSTLYPVHRAMLCRSEFFLTMFSSSFREAQDSPHLQIVSIDCSPEVLEIVLNFLYAEKADIPLELAIDVLFAADLLLIDKLKQKAAVVISTLGSGSMSTLPSEDHSREDEPIDPYDVMRSAWLTRVQRLEEFAARYFAYRLEHYIDDEDFADLVKESANRITKRQETDSIELLDDIRYYLSERFRLRFEDVGLEDDEEEALAQGEIPQEPPLMADTAAPADAAKADVAPLQDSTNGETLHPPEKPVELQPHEQQQQEQQQQPDSIEAQLLSGAVRTLDGEIAGDEFAADAVNYQILLGKIDTLLERLKLDA